MVMRRGAVVSVLGALVCLFLAGVPAQASKAAPGGRVLVFKSADKRNVYHSTLKIRFDRPMDTATATRVKRAISRRLALSPGRLASPDAQPSGAYLYCNHAYSFSDSNGTFTFQHKCGGTTGPWGYRLSAGLCSLVVSDVAEKGMTWKRNGTTEPRNAAHPAEYCGYQYHAAFNPDHDYDFINYSDTLDFEIDIDGEVGAADVVAFGSFTSAGCTSGKACGLIER